MSIASNRTRRIIRRELRYALDSRCFRYTPESRRHPRGKLIDCTDIARGGRLNPRPHLTAVDKVGPGWADSVVHNLIGHRLAVDFFLDRRRCQTVAFIYLPPGRMTVTDRETNDVMRALNQPPRQRLAVKIDRLGWLRVWRSTWFIDGSHRLRAAKKHLTPL